MTTVLSSLRDLQAAVSASVFAAAVWIAGGPPPAIGPASTAERDLHHSSLQAARSPRDAELLSDVLAIGDALGAIDHAARVAVGDPGARAPDGGLPALPDRVSLLLAPGAMAASRRSAAVLLLVATEVGLRALATGDPALAAAATALTGQAREQALTIPVGADTVAVVHGLLDILDHLDTAIACTGSSPDLVRSALAPATAAFTVVARPDPTPPGAIPIASADTTRVWRVPADRTAPVLLLVDRAAPETTGGPV